jgi:hypothetical protein
MQTESAASQAKHCKGDAAFRPQILWQDVYTSLTGHTTRVLLIRALVAEDAAITSIQILKLLVANVCLLFERTFTALMVDPPKFVPLEAIGLQSAAILTLLRERPKQTISAEG